jgi:predicted acyl esterase
MRTCSWWCATLADGEESPIGAITAHHVAAAYGWLRLSHRALGGGVDAWQPVTPMSLTPVTPGDPVAVDVEIWPTSVVPAPGHRLVLEIRAHDDPGIARSHTIRAIAAGAAP